MMSKAKNRNHCPVITRQDNGSETKVSAHWMIDSMGHGICIKFGKGKCKLDGGLCPYGGKKEFNTEYQWADIYTDKYYLGGMHVHGILL